MRADVYHRARRDYQFRLPPSNADRCASCASLRWLYRKALTTGRHDCNRIGIAIADPARSVCPLYTPDPPPSPEDVARIGGDDERPYDAGVDLA